MIGKHFHQFLVKLVTPDSQNIPITSKQMLKIWIKLEQTLKYQIYLFMNFPSFFFNPLNVSYIIILTIFNIERLSQFEIIKVWITFYKICIYHIEIAFTSHINHLLNMKLMSQYQLSIPQSLFAPHSNHLIPNILNTTRNGFWKFLFFW